MQLARFSIVGAGALSLAIGSGCGSGTAGIVAGGGDGGGGSSNLASTISAFSIDDPKVSPTRVSFVVSDPEADDATVELSYQIAGAAPKPLTQIAGVRKNPASLPSSAEGIAYELEWSFADEPDLPDDASYVADIQVFGLVAGGVQEIQLGANATAIGLGNDPPEVSSAVVPSGEVDGIVGVALTIRDSSNDVVSVRVEYDVIGDEPDAGWRLARPALLESTPDYAFEGVLAAFLGSDVEFFWDTDVDLAELERDARLRFTAVDRVVEGAPLVTGAIHVDNNAAPIAQFDSGPLILNPDERRGIPIPFRVIDEESDLVDVIFQWRHEGESFPALPAAGSSLDAILADPAQRRAHRICAPYRRSAQGRVVPVDASHVRLPELASGESWLLASGLQGRTLELLRPPSTMGPITPSWRANPLVSPVAALPLGDGLTAVVVDSSDGVRLREIELSTGVVSREIAMLGPGVPSAMEFEAGGESAVVIAIDGGGAWRLERVDLKSGARTEIAVSDGREPAPVHGIASLGAHAAVITVGSSLLYCDFRDASARRVVTLQDDLATPWGVLVDPLRAERVYVAERDADRILSIDLDSHASMPVVVDTASPATIERPTALALERNRARMLVVTNDPASGSRIVGLDLGASGGNVAFPVGGPYADAIRSIAVGADGLRLAVQTSTHGLWIGGGVAQRRQVASGPDSDYQVAVDSPFDPVPGAGQAWRIGVDQGERVRADPHGVESRFVWDTTDAQHGACFLRAVARDDELGPVAQGAAPKTVRSNLDVEPLVLGGPSLTPEGPYSVATADFDRDGDLDIVSANGTSHELTIFLQVSPGEFDPEPLTLGGPGVTDFPMSVAAGDFDGDGNVDVVCSNVVGFDLKIFFQTAPGQFATQPTALGGRSVTDLPWAVATADLDGDGDLDIVSANGVGRTLTVFFQTSPGSFSRDPLILSDRSLLNPFDVVPADLDGDGDIDLVCADLQASDLKIFFQLSPGSFSKSPLVLTHALAGGESVVATDVDGDCDVDLIYLSVVFVQTAPGTFESRPAPQIRGRSLAAADLNGDGTVDLVTVHESGTRMALHFQSSTGIFSPRPLEIGGPPLTVFPYSAEAVDLDGDGRIDIAAANSASLNVTVFRQGSSASFASAPITLESPPITDTALSVASADFDGDGDLDVASANYTSRCLSVFFQTSPGVFSPQPGVLGGPSITDAPYAVAAADFDGDHRIDVVSSNYVTNFEPGNLTMFFQTEAGSFERDPLVISGPLIRRLGSMVPVDLDADGDMDIVAVRAGAHPEPGSLIVLFQTRSRSFSPVLVGDGTIAATPASVSAADLDGDGDLDLVSANGDGFIGEVTVFFQTSRGGFESRPLVLDRASTGSPSSVAAADLDGDGDMDVVASYPGPSDTQVAIWLQTAPRRFALQPTLPQLGGFAAVVTCADVDGDGDSDVISGSGTQLSVFFQSSPGRFATQPLVLGGPMVGGLPALVATDLDGDGDPDLVCTTSFSNAINVFFGGR